MPYCPSCELEYRPGVRSCPDCNVELVDGSPPQPEVSHAVPLVRLCTVADPSEGDVIQVALAEAGIPATVRRHGPITGELGRVTDGMTEDYAIVSVPEDMLEEARDLLKELEEGKFEWPDGMEPDEGDEEEEDESSDRP
ncbi:MAG: hypothetical protein MUQ65_00345 [Armatimonadetes bacterium]|nr:hypothetical protein [Armatimonadota bacterium]